MKSKAILLWICRIVSALIMLQTLYFKFTAHPESVQLFSELGVEPWGRIGTGVVELIASLLILVPKTSWLGAIIGAGTMLGAIFSHIAIIGISFGGSPLLFIYAIVVLLCCLSIIYLQKENIQHRLQLFTR